MNNKNLKRENSFISTTFNIILRLIKFSMFSYKKNLVFNRSLIERARNKYIPFRATVYIKLNEFPRIKRTFKSSISLYRTYNVLILKYKSVELMNKYNLISTTMYSVNKYTRIYQQKTGSHSIYNTI